MDRRTPLCSVLIVRKGGVGSRPSLNTGGVHSGNPHISNLSFSSNGSGGKPIRDGLAKRRQDINDGEVDFSFHIDRPPFRKPVLRDAGREPSHVRDDVALDQQIVRVVHQRVRRPSVVLLQVRVPHLHVAAHPYGLAHRPRPRHGADQLGAFLHEG